MADLMTKLSFIFLCDGPCVSSSWKDEDVSMYWARRDALIRITIMSLWQGPGMQCLASDDCSLLFHELISVGGTALKDDLLAVMTMSGPHLVSMLPIPNESSLMRIWKEAATVATKFPQRAEIGSAPAIIDKRSDGGSQSGVQMSFTPWREAAFLPCPTTSLNLSTSSSSKAKMGLVKEDREDFSSRDTAVKSNHCILKSQPLLNGTVSGEVNSVRSNKNSGYNNSLNINDTDSLDKRYILRAMQKSCSLEFLRKHNLNGTEELILKKRNKASILVAYKDWMDVATDIKVDEVIKHTDKQGIFRSPKASNLVESKSKSRDCGANMGKDSDQMKSISDRDNSIEATNDFSKNLEEDVIQLRRQHLEDTFAVLYNRHCKGPRTKKPRITILLLHEDYPHELPVFGYNNSNCSQPHKSSDSCSFSNTDSVGINIDGDCSGQQKKKVKRKNLNENSGNDGESSKAGHQDDEIKRINCDHDTAGDHRVICILGAVRDASDSEIMAAIIAAKRLGYRCVGANLGRTAEFTSKIVAAMIGHGLAGHLGDAVDLLPSINTSTAMFSSPSPSSTSASASSSSSSRSSSSSSSVLSTTLHSNKPLSTSAVLSSSSATSNIIEVREVGIQKLVPKRTGGWSWDGKSNKTARISTIVTMDERNSSIQYSGVVKGKSNIIQKKINRYSNVIDDSSSSSSSRSRSDRCGSNNIENISNSYNFDDTNDNTDNTDRNSNNNCNNNINNNDTNNNNNNDIHLNSSRVSFHAILWLPYNAKDIRIESQYRERFHILIQTIVCTLWRSRIASEAAHFKRDEHHSNEMRNKCKDITQVNKLVENINKNDSPSAGRKMTDNCDSNNNDNNNNNNDNNNNNNNNINNDNNNNNNNNNNNHADESYNFHQDVSHNINLKSKKRKAIDTIPSSSSSKNTIDPILSLVFIDGSTVTITQAQLTLSMADKRMAAPSEFQVLSTLISFLNDPLLNLLKHPILNTTPVCSASPPKGSLDEESATPFYKTDSDSWITILETLLPKNLNKKQRKKIKIIDVIDLISYGGDASSKKSFSNSSMLKKNLYNNFYTEIKNKLNDGENSLKSDDNQSFSSSDRIKFNAIECSGRGSGSDDVDGDGGGGGDNNNCLSNIAYNMMCGCNHPVVEEDNQGLEQSDGEDVHRVIIILRPQREYQKENQRKSPTFGIGSNKSVLTWRKEVGMIVQNNTIQDNTYHEVERCKLNHMLNNWLYRKKIHKHDSAKQSSLYLKSAIFAQQNKLEEKKMKEKEGFESVSTDLNVRLISPGVAVCVLQHWAYHQVLIPTLDAALKQYQ